MLILSKCKNLCMIISIGLGISLVLWLGALFGQSDIVARAGVNWPQISLTREFSGLSQPVHITHAGDGSGRLFVIEQVGRIRIIKNGVLLSTPFLNITSRVGCCGERGMLSVAFPPGYGNKGYFYVYYTNTSGNIVVARYFLTSNPDIADPNSEQIVLTISHPTFANHNGGQLAFGPDDGYLYLGTGDGGGAGDPSGNAQNPNSLLGKILRIDVESGNPTRQNPTTYTIPSTNPYAQTQGYRGEIWALGLRNPWRFSFDRQTHDLYIGDVGQDTEEEVDFQSASSTGGENYGWNILEGSLCFNPPSGCVPPSMYSPPVSEYNHGSNDSIGCAVTGGFVYRGVNYPDMQGIYFYGDYCTGRIWGLKFDGSAWQSTLLLDTTYTISTFGEGEDGNLYLADYANGDIYMLKTGPNCVGISSFVIKGKVETASGNSIPGVMITLSGPNKCTDIKTTNTLGKYRFQKLSNGTYIVTPSRAGCSFTPPSQMVTISGIREVAKFTGSCP